MILACLVLLCVIPGSSLAELRPRVDKSIKIDWENKVVRMGLRPDHVSVTLPDGQMEMTRTFPIVGPDQLNQNELLYWIGSNLSPAGMKADWDKEGPWLINKPNPRPPLSYRFRLYAFDKTGTDFPMEVVVKLQWRALASNKISPWSSWRLLVDDRHYYLTNAAFDSKYLNEFRDLLIADASNYVVDIRPPNIWDSSLASLELAVTLRKKNTCQMMVSYAGDIEGSDSGDLAYYNNFMKVGGAFEGGVGRATGSGSDTKALEALGAVVDWNKATEQDVLSAAEASAMAGSNFDPLADTTAGGGSDSPDQKINDAIKKKKSDDKANLNKDEFYSWLRGEPDERETFGLSMAGRNADQTSAQVKGVEIDKIRGVGQLVTSSVLLAASRDKLVDKLVALADNPEKDSKWDGVIPLSRLEFRPMAMGALFSWSEGKPGYGKLKVDGFSGGKLRGTIDGELYSREMRRPDGSSSQIKIHATFMAAEGAFGCDLPGVGKVLK